MNMAELTPSERTLIDASRRRRPQGFVCDDGLVRCQGCATEYSVVLGHGEAAIERYTPILGDGDDWCSVCDVDIKARPA